MTLKLKLLLKLLAVKAVILCFLFFVVSVFAQSAPQPVPTSPIPPDSSMMTHDVWFWVFVAWYVFSACVSGMPEPTPNSSPWWIWAYRSGHILAANGTSFFQNKLYWPTHPIEVPRQ